MQIYKQKDIQEIKSELINLNWRYSDLQMKILGLSGKLKEDKSKEYLHQGAERRLGVIKRCVENIFSIFPADRGSLLCHDELADVEINLHAFFVNISGLLDNLAWVVIYEKQLADVIDKERVGLFRKETKKHLSSAFCQYLNSNQMKIWHGQYLKNYRDALSHRIPLYVPPQTLNVEQKELWEKIEKKIANSFKSRDFDAVDKLRSEQNNIGSICPVFVHALSENKPLFLHVQLISDFMTIEEIIEKYCEMFFGK
jgi:hypothetical protein